MNEDELFNINADTQAELWAPAAMKSLAAMKHEKRQRYEELLIKLRGRKVPRLTQLDREVDKVIAAAKAKKSRPEVPDDGFERTDDGAVMPTQGNIRLAVDRLGVKLRYDEFRGTPAIEGLEGFGPWLDDPAMTRLWLLIDEQFGFRPRRDFFDAVVSDACQRGKFHPVRDYLDALSWDGTPRLDDWLVTYFGAEDTLLPPSRTTSIVAPLSLAGWVAALPARPRCEQDGAEGGLGRPIPERWATRPHTGDVAPPGHLPPPPPIHRACAPVCGSTSSASAMKAIKPPRTGVA